MSAICSSLRPRQFLPSARVCCTIRWLLYTTGLRKHGSQENNKQDDLAPWQCYDARMSGPHRRVQPWALVAPLTLVTAAASLSPITAGARPGIQGHSARTNAQAMAGEADVGRIYPRPVLKPSAIPAVPPPRWAQIPGTFHARRARPNSHQPTRPQHAKSRQSVRAAVFQQPHSLTLMLLNHAVLDMKAGGASANLLAFMNQPRNLVSTPLDKPKPLKHATRKQVFSS